MKTALRHAIVLVIVFLGALGFAAAREARVKRNVSRIAAILVGPCLVAGGLWMQFELWTDDYVAGDRGATKSVLHVLP